MKTKETVIKMAVFLVLLFGPTGCGQEEAVRDSADILQTEEQENLTERQENPVGEQEDPAKQQEDLAEQGDSSEAVDSSDSIVEISPGGEKIEWAVYSEGVYCYRNVRNYASDEGGLYGYLSEDGREITPCIYSEAAPFSEGLGCALLDGKYGYIGKDGEAVLPFIYDQASPFREGVAYFSIGEQYGLIDREGNVILELTDCDSISSFREGLAYFSVDGRYGYMDKNGKIIVEPVYEDAGYFYGDRAMVMKDGLFGVVGKDGREILPPEYIDIRLKDNCIIARKEERYYFFDAEGREVSSGAWDSVALGADGIFDIYHDGKMGAADENGKLILEPVYEFIFPIAERKLLIAENEDGLDGVLDYEGQTVVPFIYRTISDMGYEDGGLVVTDAETGKAGYLAGDDFSLQIPMIYDSFVQLTKDRAVVMQDEKYGVIRYDGTVEIPFEYDRIKLFSDGSRAVWKDSRIELTDSQGNLIYQEYAAGHSSVVEKGDGYEISITKDADGEDISYLSRENISFIDKQGKRVTSGYRFCDAVYGAENTYLLDNGLLLIIGEEEGTDVEDALLTNQITPKLMPFVELLKGEEHSAYSEEEWTAWYMGEMWRYWKFKKLYRPGNANETMLYFYVAPWRKENFPESYSKLFAIEDGKVKAVVAGTECGGSFRGDYVCFWYDKEEKTLKPGTMGMWGGFGGYACSDEVYSLKNGDAVLEISRMQYNQSAANYDEKILLENAELFYDMEGGTYTKETILEAEDVIEYEVNEKQVSREEYEEAGRRYIRCYLPFEGCERRDGI